mmetsp:Transcript_60781/g.131833  ORF Transcript_60781/g.131833 Transcript_60781/m.131833 type:complete len:777 (-) Transcript_60781:22-2352(-)
MITAIGQRLSPDDVSTEVVALPEPRVHELGAGSPENGQGLSVTRQELVNYLLSDRIQTGSCATLPCTLLIWIAFILVFWLRGNVESAYRLQRSIHEGISEIQVQHTIPGSIVTRTLRLDTMTTSGEVQTWIASGLIPSLSGPEGQPGRTRTFNRVIGEVQLRQQRARQSNCQVDEGLTLHYGLTCFDGRRDLATFGVEGGADSVQQDPAFVAGAGLDGLPEADRVRLGFIAWLKVGGLKTSLPTAIGTSGASGASSRSSAGEAAEGTLRAEELFAAGWIDEQTQQLEVHIALFNAEVRSYCHVLLTFFFRDGGLARSKLEVRPFTGDVYPTALYVVVDIVWATLMLGLLLWTLQLSCEGRRRGRGCADGWFLLDYVSSLVGILLVILFIIFALKLSGLSQMLVQLVTDEEAAKSQVGQAAQRASQRYYEGLVLIIWDFENLVLVKSLHRLSMLWYGVFIMLRFFRGFHGQPRIAVIGRTIFLSASYLLHFVLILAVVFANFVIGAYVLFGSQLQAWSSMSKAIRSTLSVLLGRGDFAEMYDLHPISATVWLVASIVLFVFLLTNMMLAIIVDHHIEVCTERRQAGWSMWRQCKDSLDEAWWQGSYSFRVMYRQFHSQLSPANAARWRRLDSETERRELPLENILAAVGADDEGRLPSDPPPWTRVDIAMLQDFGCDSITAERVMRKCMAFARESTPETYPPDRLLAELDGVMQQCYLSVDSLREELQERLSQKLVECSNLEPRQKKLDGLARNIQPADSTEPPASRLQLTAPLSAT